MSWLLVGVALWLIVGAATGIVFARFAERDDDIETLILIGVIGWPWIVALAIVITLLGGLGRIARWRRHR